MRRSDREVKDWNTIVDIVSSSSVCHLALTDGVKPYVIPLNYGFEEVNGKMTFYFHGAGEGRKIDMIEANDNACISIENEYNLVPGENACSYTASFQSVIAEGKIRFFTDLDEKKHALERIMYQSTGKDSWSFDERMVSAVTVLVLDADTVSGKIHA